MALTTASVATLSAVSGCTALAWQSGASYVGSKGQSSKSCLTVAAANRACRLQTWCAATTAAPRVLAATTTIPMLQRPRSAAPAEVSATAAVPARCSRFMVPCRMLQLPLQCMRASYPGPTMVSVCLPTGSVFPLNPVSNTTKQVCCPPGTFGYSSESGPACCAAGMLPLKAIHAGLSGVWFAFGQLALAALPPCMFSPLARLIIPAQPTTTTLPPPAASQARPWRHWGVEWPERLVCTCPLCYHWG